MLADWRELTKRKEPEDFIISLRQSVPHDRAWLARTLAGRNLVVHSFRHTCVSLMRNVAPDEIETAMSGNASKKALDIYTHRNSADLLARLEPARDRVEAFWKAEDNTGNPRAGDGRK
jgi:integrase